jgi:TonB family protein
VDAGARVRTMVRMADGWTDSPGRSRRGLTAIGLSLVINGGLIAAALLLHHRAEPAPTAPSLTDIEVVEPAAAPAPPSAAGQRHGAADTNAGTHGRRGHDAPLRSQNRAPAVADPYADLAMSYETPGPDPGSTTTDSTGGAHGGGLFGDGTGSGLGAGDGLGAGNGLPPAPVPSLARPPRPKHEYRDWDYRAPIEYAGRSILIELSLDPRGSVRGARILQGVEDKLDKAAVATASRYEFYPALNSVGSPIAAVYRWEFQLEATNQ